MSEKSIRRHRGSSPLHIPQVSFAVTHPILCLECPICKMGTVKSPSLAKSEQHREGVALRMEECGRNPSDPMFLTTVFPSTPQSTTKQGAISSNPAQSRIFLVKKLRRRKLNQPENKWMRTEQPCSVWLQRHLAVASYLRAFQAYTKCGIHLV